MDDVYKSCKIVLLSSQSIDYLTRYKETGLINEFLIKPINASLLYEIILDVFSDHHSIGMINLQLFKEFALSMSKILVVEDNAF